MYFMYSLQFECITAKLKLKLGQLGQRRKITLVLAAENHDDIFAISILEKKGPPPILIKKTKPAHHKCPTTPRITKKIWLLH